MEPRVILESLFPTLKLAASYSKEIQGRIQALPEKAEYGENFYATALTDADLTIQATVELILLAQFPQIRFFGEEHERSYNTKYFSSISLGSEEELLVTLDPIDGTRAYLDGLPNYAIIVTIIKGKSYQGILVIQPRGDRYIVALKGEGAFVGNLGDTQLNFSQPIQLETLKSDRLYLSFGLAHLKDILAPEFSCWCSATDYNPEIKPPEYLNLLHGDLAGVILEKGNLIDSAGLAFIAQEAGAVVTLWDGSSFEPFTEVEKMRIPGMVIAHNPEVHQKLLSYLTKSRTYQEQ